MEAASEILLIADEQGGEGEVAFAKQKFRVQHLQSRSLICVRQYTFLVVESLRS